MVRMARDIPADLALGLLDVSSKLLDVARVVSQSPAGPVLGGVAVFLHGYERTTADVDVFSDDSQRSAKALEDLGATWDAERREHVLDGVPIHIVTIRATGDGPKQVSEIRGVRCVSLADLIRFKLRAGLAEFGRAKDLADVEELIRRVPLDKSFAVKLPTELRADFKRLVDRVARSRDHRDFLSDSPKDKSS